MVLEIIGAESLGVRSLCCLVTLADRRIVIDPGVSLGYVRFGLLPHPLQIAVGQKVRGKILHVLRGATDVVFSHFHGDHAPLKDANPYQLPVRALPACFGELRGWSQSPDDLSVDMSTRFQDLADLMGAYLQVAEVVRKGPYHFPKSCHMGRRTVIGYLDDDSDRHG